MPTSRPSKHGLTSHERPDLIGYAVAALDRVARMPALDRLGLRRPTERVVFEAARTGFRTAGAVNRGSPGPDVRTQARPGCRTPRTPAPST